MQDETTLAITHGNLSLDGRVRVPTAPRAACVVLHPHPLYGGDMRNGVVLALCRALADAGVATLRFDFRGVGASGGRHDGGEGEVDDAQAAVAALARESGAAEVAVAGYSFGAAVALRLAARGGSGAGIPLSCVAAVAPPLAVFDASFAASLAPRLLVVAGDRDEYCPPSRLDAFAALLTATASVQRLAGADHFLGGHEPAAAAAVARFVVAS